MVSEHELIGLIEKVTTKIVPIAPDPQLVADIIAVVTVVILDLHTIASAQERLAILKAKELGVGNPG